MSAPVPPTAHPHHDPRPPVLVVGLGLSGVSALRYLVQQGRRVTVTDSRAEPAGIAALRAAYPQVRFHLGGFDAPGPLSAYAEAVVSPGWTFVRRSSRNCATRPCR